MMTCHHCNAQTAQDALICDTCGAELSSQAPSQRNTGPNAATGVTLPVPIAPIPRLPATPATWTPPRALALRLRNGQRFILSGKSDYTIGRTRAGSPPPDVDLSRAHGTEAGVSREHISVHIRANGVFVEDLESKNETIHNGYRLLPRQWYPLHDGDELMLGEITLYVAFE